MPEQKIYAVEANVPRTYESLLVYVEAGTPEDAERRLKRFLTTVATWRDDPPNVKAEEQSVVVRTTGRGDG